MYVLIIARGYPTEKYKTNGIFEFDQAKALAQKGCKVVYAAIDLRSIRRWRKWGIIREEISGVDVYAINMPIGRVPKTILRRFSFLGLELLYNKIIKEHGKPDIMHAHFTGPAYAVSKLKDKTDNPLVVTEHSSQINKENIDEDLFKIANITYSKADSLIAVSPSLVEKIDNNFGIKSTYIPNIVDLEIFNYEDKKNSDSFNFVSIGNLVDIKRMDLTIEAFYEAFENDSNITLTIFGQGPKRTMLEDLIKKYSLGSQVKLMGLCSRKEIAEQLKKSDCFVLPSQSETFGVAYIEALAMGVPVIATKCGGPEGFVNKNNGIMIDIDNKKQLIEAMKYMHENVERYDRADIAIKIKEKFSHDIVGNQIIEIYREVLRSR